MTEKTAIVCDECGKVVLDVHKSQIIHLAEKSVPCRLQFIGSDGSFHLTDKDWCPDCLIQALQKWIRDNTRKRKYERKNPEPSMAGIGGAPPGVNFPLSGESLEDEEVEIPPTKPTFQKATLKISQPLVGDIRARIDLSPPPPSIGLFAYGDTEKEALENLMNDQNLTIEELLAILSKVAQKRVKEILGI